VTAPDHPFDRDLTDVRLAQHLGAAHSYHSSSDLENFEATHRKLHGVPSASEERHQANLAKAWDEGYAAGDRDAYHSSKARAWNGRTLDNDELTPNPYLTEAEPVSTVPTPKVQTNSDLWRN
jgi:hypothetical protein